MKNVQMRLGVICRFSHVKDDVHWIPVSSAQEAVQKLKAYVKKNVFENWHFLGGDVKVDGKVVALIQEYGGICPPSKKGNDCYELLADWQKSMTIDELQALME